MRENSLDVRRLPGRLPGSELLLEVVLPAVLGLPGAAFGEGFQDTVPTDDHHAQDLYGPAPTASRARLRSEAVHPR